MTERLMAAHPDWLVAPFARNLSADRECLPAVMGSGTGAHIKTALPGNGAGPGFFTNAFYRERDVKIGPSAVCLTGIGSGFVLFGFRRFTTGGRAIAAIVGHQVHRLVGVAAILKRFHARNGRGIGGTGNFTGFGCRMIGQDRCTRCSAFAVFRGGAEHAGRVVGILGHGDGGGCTGNQKKASHGQGDFAAFVLCHNAVSLWLIRLWSLLVARIFVVAPLKSTLNALCAEKSDQMCRFQGLLAGKWPHSTGIPAIFARKTARIAGISGAKLAIDFIKTTRKQEFGNASPGDLMRRVARGDGLAYVRRNPMIDGDTAR